MGCSRRSLHDRCQRPDATGHRATQDLVRQHEALAHEARGLADDASRLTADGVDAFAQRFGAFDSELRNHSEVEDGIMFPAMLAAGGAVPEHLGREHRDEQSRLLRTIIASMPSDPRMQPWVAAALTPEHLAA